MMIAITNGTTSSENIAMIETQELRGADRLISSLTVVLLKSLSQEFEQKERDFCFTPACGHPMSLRLQGVF